MGVLVYSPSGFALRWMYSKVRPEPTTAESVSLEIASAGFDLMSIKFLLDVFVFNKTYVGASALDLFQVNQFVRQAKFVTNPYVWGAAIYGVAVVGMARHAEELIAYSPVLGRPDVAQAMLDRLGRRLN